MEQRNNEFLQRKKEYEEQERLRRKAEERRKFEERMAEFERERAAEHERLKKIDLGIILKANSDILWNISF